MSFSHSRSSDSATSRRLPEGLYLVLDPTMCLKRPLEEIVRVALTAGVRTFQLRVKTPHTGEFYTLAASLAPLIQGAGGCLIVNDRCDVALAVGADGVHLGQEDLPLAEARTVVGANMLVGISTHTFEQAVQAEAAGADYIGFGPIFPTTSKSHPDPVVGLEGLREVCRRVRLPIVAIGGITPGNIREVVAAGSDTPAVLSAVLAAPDPAAALANLLRAIESPHR